LILIIEVCVTVNINNFEFDVLCTIQPGLSSFDEDGLEETPSFEGNFHFFFVKIY